MARSSATATPRRANPATAGSSDKKKQSTLMNFFSKKPVAANSNKSSQTQLASPSSSPSKSASDDDVVMIDEGKNSKGAGTSIVTETKDRDSMITPVSPSESVIKRPLKANNANLTINDKEEDKVEDSRERLPQSSPTKNSRRTQKKVTYSEVSDDDDEDEIKVSKSQRKKRCLIANDDASDDEFVPEARGESDDDDKDADFVVPDDFEEDKIQPETLDEDDDNDFLEVSKPKAKVESPKPQTSLSTKFSSSSDYKSTPSKTSPKPSVSKHTAKQAKSQKFTKENEERYQWLVNIRDSEKRSVSDSNYDPRTLYIPSSAWAKFTSFEKQYWEIKSQMWDCIVFFKKGKFYELYEKDAFIAHNEFDLKIAGGGRANMQLAGIPEMSFNYWATSFISKGYKVAKVDQIETGLAKEIREANGPAKGKKDVIQRELKCVLTAGTLTDENMLTDDMATYCVAIKEDIDHDDPSSKIFGVSFIDTSTGIINVTEFKDDSECTIFETLISQLRPKEIIFSKSNLSPTALRVLKFNSQNNAIFNNIKPDVEFFDFDTTFETLARSKYFPAENLDDLSQWPEILKQYYEDRKMAGFSSFGGLLWYLKSLKLDESLISLGNISTHTTIKPLTSLVLDGQTLQNLEIFANSFDGTDKGTLFKLVDRATTAFGKRLLKTWVVHPLLRKEDIEARFDSVDQLLEDVDLRYLIDNSLNKLPDLERLLSRIHAGQLKLKDFTRVIEGFEEVATLVEKIKTHELKGLLNGLVFNFPKDLDECLQKWEDVYDRIKAKDEDVLILSKGQEEDYDESKDKINDLETQLSIKLKEYRREFKTQSIEYKDSGKELYTIEMPATKKVPDSWKQMGASKKTKRWWSPEVETLSKQVARARESHKLIEESLKSRMFQKFDNDYKTWIKVIETISKIDCLSSLAKTSESIGFPATRPQFIDSETGFLEFKDLRHPCFNLGVSTQKEFIPNDVKLGHDAANLGLLTGANAAGKSTVLRMTCIAVILAQIGCYVPCEYAQMTPIDRIMTRLGANDNIMQGKSTFFVELSETKKILENSSPRSLLVVDELGRGGSSSDGFAIAEAVLHHVATHIQSLGFFATHYASLGQSFKFHPQVKPLRMAIIVDDASKNITFLYKLQEGAAEGSFGMHVASMCGIDKEIIENSEVAAESFEHTSKLKKKLMENNTEIVPLGLQSDFARIFKNGLSNVGEGCGEGVLVYNETVKKNALRSIFSMIDKL
jgi:DNA mismatch repair protein MSH6